FVLIISRPLLPTLFPYTTLFRSGNRVESPVNKQPVFGLTEPFAARVVHLALGVFGAGHRDGGAWRRRRLLSLLIRLLIGLLSCRIEAKGAGDCHDDQEQRYDPPRDNGQDSGLVD